MSTVWYLILFSGIGALICARTRAAGPALLFGVTAVALLFLGTGAGEWISNLFHSVSAFHATASKK